MSDGHVAKMLGLFLVLSTYGSYVVSANVNLSPGRNPEHSLEKQLIPANVSIFGAPTPPSQFVTSINYDTSIKLNPLAVYLCAIDSMYRFSLVGWHEVLLESFTIWAEGFNVKFDVSPTHGSLPLEVSHVIFGLYETMVDVAAHSRFCEVLATLSLHRRQIGSLAIERKTYPRLGLGGTYATNSTMVKVSPQSNDVTYPSGHFVDPDDPEFSISYTFNGTRINSKGVFLVVLDALAIAAQFSQGEAFESLDATTPSGDCTMSVVGFEGPFGPNYSFASKALRILVVDIMVFLGKFEEITFELKWETINKMAEGSIKLAKPASSAQIE